MAAHPARPRVPLRIRLAAGCAALAGVVACVASTPAHTSAPRHEARQPICGFCWHT